MKWTQIATDGGLLPTPITRDSFELWPAKRREFIVDFTKYFGRHADDQGRRDLSDQHHEDAHRTDVVELVALLTGPQLQDSDAQVRRRRRCPGQQRDPNRV
jgi:FtsP/CotA-like multicopper oxidase with cupredoxin domain